MSITYTIYEGKNAVVGWMKNNIHLNFYINLLYLHLFDMEFLGEFECTSVMKSTFLSILQCSLQLKNECKSAKVINKHARYLAACIAKQNIRGSCL